MNKLSFTLPCLLLVSSVAANDVNYTIEINNPLATARLDHPVVIDIKSLDAPITPLGVRIKDGAYEIPCQIDDLDFDGVPDEIAFVIDMGANQKKTLDLRLSDSKPQKEYPPRVFATFMLRGPKKGQYPPIREVCVPGNVDFYNMVYGHGPMFESELVGYRVYFNEKQTLDPYGKFKKGLELEDTNFYPTDEHIAQGYGDDVLLAGNSCGIGAFKGWNGNEAIHITPVKYRTERLIASGPIRTITEVEVTDWTYDSVNIDMINRYTLYAGHRDLQVDVKFDKPLSQQEFATGVERIMGNETVSWNDGHGLVASWGRHWPVNDTIKYAKETIGIATYIPEKYVVKYAEDPSNFLYVVNAPGLDGLKYYTMFTSRKEKFGYTSSDEWFGYLPKWREDIENPLIINIIKN